MDKTRMEILHNEIDTIQLIIGRMQIFCAFENNYQLSTELASSTELIINYQILNYEI